MFQAKIKDSIKGLDKEFEIFQESLKKDKMRNQPEHALKKKDTFRQNRILKK